MHRETMSIQGTFHGTVAAIAETFDRPAMWGDPYIRFRENRPSNTGSQIGVIRRVLTRIDLRKAQSISLAMLIKDEITQKGRLPQTESTVGPMLHLLHARLQQMRG
jgi:hypothetical protein